MSDEKKRIDFDGMIQMRNNLKRTIEEAGDFETFWAAYGIDREDVIRIVGDAWAEMSLRASLRPLPEAWQRAMILGVMYGFFLADEMAKQASFEAEVMGGLDELPTTDEGGESA